MSQQQVVNTQQQSKITINRTAAAVAAAKNAERSEERHWLAADDLQIQFSGGGRLARAVDDINLEVAAGEIVCLVGESGSGKTTAARALLGLVSPTAGQVSLDGVPLRRSTRALKAHRRRVQLVLQDPTGALNPRHTVYQAVAEGVRIHRLGNEQQRVSTALEQVGLRPVERFSRRYPHELSGGQRQRVVIAGALALNPQVIVADEPVASLDASVRGEILALFLQLRDELGVGSLIVTHDLGMAWNVADRIAVMYLGRIVESGPAEQVLQQPEHPYTKALLAALPHTGNPQELSGEMPDPTAIPAGCRFHPRCPARISGEAADVEELCTGSDLPILTAGHDHQAACHLIKRA